MSQWSIPLQPRQGWSLRVLSGKSIGQEYALPPSRYVLGSQSPANILIPDASIAPQHVAFVIHRDYVQIDDCSGGRGMQVNGKRVQSSRLLPGDHVTVGTFKFEFSNPGLPAVVRPGGADSFLSKLAGLKLWMRVGVVSFLIAFGLFLLLVITRTPTLVPVTLIAMSAVVPATMICWLVESYDKTGISFHTLVITFLAGGTIGIISAMIFFVVGEVTTFGLFLLPIFAGVAEEPAKLLATVWRWRHRAYDRPMDGLIIGTVSGFGFAVFETAGYGFTALMEDGLAGMGLTLLIRGVTSPFGHGLWSGILAAAFWQCGRDLRRAVNARQFWIALAWAVGLHALWNLPALLSIWGLPALVASAVLSVREYRKLLRNRGYRA